MTRTEHLLTILAEECAEVAQRVSKALRFGLHEIQEGQPLNNADRILAELRDLDEAVNMLVKEGSLTTHPSIRTEAHDQKRAKVERLLLMSAKLGTLNENAGTASSTRMEPSPSQPVLTLPRLHCGCWGQCQYPAVPTDSAGHFFGG